MDMTVLVVTDGDPATAALTAHLRADGVPFETVDLRAPGRPVIDAGFLADADGPNFQAVVLPEADPFGGSPELAALHAYERRYDVRQVNAYVWPAPAVGLRKAACSGPRPAARRPGHRHRAARPGRAADRAGGQHRRRRRVRRRVRGQPVGVDRRGGHRGDRAARITLSRPRGRRIKEKKAGKTLSVRPGTATSVPARGVP